MKIVFATNNAHKLKELQAMLPPIIKVISLKDIGCHEEIAETALTLEGNAIIKANYITEQYGYDCFADDTGLEVAALNGAPGVFSARYAGKAGDANANMDLLIAKMQGITNRSARFRTVIALNLKGQQYLFEGLCPGSILKQPQGQQGFGYDPIFMPEGYNTSFAQMSLEAKGAISHRGKAVGELVEFLNTL